MIIFCFDSKSFNRHWSYLINKKILLYITLISILFCESLKRLKSNILRMSLCIRADSAVTFPPLMMATFKITNPSSAHYETHNRNENTCPEIGETFTFTNLADALSKATYIQVIHLYCQYMCSLGIEPTTFVLLTQCSNHWATGTLQPQEQ